MKTKKILVAIPMMFTALSLVACGNSGGGGDDTGPVIPDMATYEMPEDFAGSGEIKVWVGEESVVTYQTLANAWVEEHKTLNPEFNFTVLVEAHDSGSVAGTFEQDASLCADIVTAAHDNVGKLAQAKYVKPMVHKGLVDQIAADNSASFNSVARSVVDGTRAVYAAPYISQSLFLMYDKRYVSAEQAQTFEGLQEAARNATQSVGHEVKAVTVAGTDGYNFSFTVLAVNNATKETTMSIYKDGERTDCWAQGEDSVANLQWARRYYSEANGLTWASTQGWETDVANHGVISLISGSWKYKAFCDSIGLTNVGVAMIPTYTLTDADVAGTTMTAGTVMRGGTFADCKCFLINAYSDGSKYIAEQSLIKYLSSKESQNYSFKECNNLPAYVGADEYIESIKDEISVSSYQMALAQNRMAAYGKPQPFIDGTLNSFFYSKGAPALYTMVVENTDGLYGTTLAARQILYRMQNIWEKGKDPVKTMPSTFPSQI